MEEVVKRYNPQNAANLSDADKEAIGSLTEAEIFALAEAYPNKANQTNYLILQDKNEKDPKKQLFPRSSWENLAALFRAGQRQYFVAGFANGFQRPATGPKVAPVQDLTAAQAKRELKQAPAQKLKVAKDESGGTDEGGSANDGAQDGGTGASLSELSTADLKAHYEKATGKKAGKKGAATMIAEIEAIENK